MTSQDRFTARQMTEEEIAKKALFYRSKFGATDELCINIIEILEFQVREFVPEFKLMIRRDIELETTATTIFDPPRILVRETIYDAACEGDVDARRILAHELGHLLLHSHIGSPLQRDPGGYTPQFRGLTRRESTEAQADSFACHFLIHPRIAYERRHDVIGLSNDTKTPLPTASDAIRIAKRQEMISVRTRRRSHIPLDALSS
ncbi:MAG: ImmA/IrrE family metallo-endopeptidase [Rhizobiaceae bacterium]|nr:ImmA/IrrE family metallo-endopeptidase [Rhizobiaceae bacterium]